jgi:uncharacterized protein YndB with AHSA1/START domain
MNIILIILAVVASLIILLLVIALFVKKEYSIEREIVIYHPKAKVFEYIRSLRNQDNFSKWATMDPNMKKEYTGTDGTVGFVSSWESENKNVGKGSQQISKIAEGERIDFNIHFIKPFEGLAKAYLTTESKGENQTLVKWGFESAMKYPMNLMLLFMNMEKMLGNDLEIGLSNLKTKMGIV